MTYIYHNGGEEAASGFRKLLEELKPGDCLAVEHLGCVAKDGASLLSLLEQLEAKEIRFRSAAENFDTGTEQGRFAYELLKKVAQLDRKEKPEPREDTHTKGRKPIECPEFTTVAMQWRAGEIMAVEAMRRLGMSSSTFYRKIKELNFEK